MKSLPLIFATTASLLALVSRPSAADGDSRTDQQAVEQRYDVSKVTQADIVPWVERSFRWAHEANPDGEFVLNEFFLFAKPAGRRKFHALTKELRGLPVRGLGIQAHEPRQMWFPPAQVNSGAPIVPNHWARGKHGTGGKSRFGVFSVFLGGRRAY